MASDGVVTVSERRSTGRDTASKYIGRVVSRRRPLSLLLSLVVVFWGGAFVAIRILVRHASALTVAQLRFTLTTLGLLAVVAAVRPPRPRIDRADRWKIAVLAVTGVAIYHVSLNYGEHFVTAPVASLIVAAMPVMVAILSRLFLREVIGPAKWAGIVLALAGVVVLITWGTPGAKLSITDGFGTAVVAIAPVSWATYTVTSKSIVSRYGPLWLTTIATGLGTLLLAPIALPAVVHDLPRLTPSDWGWIAFLALACSTFAYAVWFYALSVMEASRVAAWVYLVPLLALLWAAVVLGESITVYVALGGAMVLAGVILTERVSPAVDSRAEERPAA